MAIYVCQMNCLNFCYSSKMVDVRGLYLHVPFCSGKCAYCAFYSVRHEPALAEAYIQALSLEAERYRDIQPRTVYIGGGTPSVLPSALLEKLLGIVRGLSGGAMPEEWTVEVNPESAGRDLFRIMADAGVNRVSIGAQVFDDGALRRLGRRHFKDDIARTISDARAAGFQNVSLDLMASVPGVSRRAWLETLARAAALMPEHISVYALTLEEGSLLSAQSDAGVLRIAAEDEQLQALHSAERALRRRGFHRYEISNYAMPGFECRHNLSCWRGEDYIGLGPAASSRVGMLRWTNKADIKAWASALEKGTTPPAVLDPLTPEMDQTERLVFGLRMAEGVPEFLAKGREKAVALLRRNRLLRIANGRCLLTARGRDMADYVGLELMP